MKKIIAGVVGIAVIGGLAAAPYVSGMLIEKRLQNMKVLPGADGSGLVWSLDSFQRGYLHSTATSSMKINAGDGESFVLHFKQDIDQMPGLDGRYATIHTVWVPDAAQAADVKKLYGDTPPVVVDTILKVTGSSQSVGTLTPVKTDNVNFSGGTIKGDTTAGGHFSYTMTMDSLTGTDLPGKTGAESLAIKGVDFSGEGQVTGKNIVWDSHFAMKVASVVAGSEGSMSGLSLVGTTSRTGDDAAFDVTYGVQKLEFPEAPAWAKTMSDIKVNFGLSRIDAPVMEKVVTQIQEAKKQGNIDNDQIKQALTQTMITEMPALLDRGPIFTMNPVTFTVPSGSATFHVSVELPPGHGKEGSKNPMLLLGLLKVQGDISMPQTLMMDLMAKQGKAEDGAQNLAAMVKQGYVTEDKGMLSSKFAFTDGKLTVNGLPANQMAGMLGALSGGM